MKRVTGLLTCIAALATLIILVLAADKPLSVATLGFMAWGLSPYVYLFAMGRRAATGPASVTALVIAVLTAILGVWFPFDAMYLHQDAQSALVFLFAPLWQWFLLLIASVPFYFLNQTVLHSRHGED